MGYGLGPRGQRCARWRVPGGQCWLTSGEGALLRAGSGMTPSRAQGSGQPEPHDPGSAGVVDRAEGPLS